MRKFFLATALALCTTAFAVEATVISVTGKAELQDGGRWTALREGGKVEKGAVISTGFKSEAVIEFKGTRFTLGALTRITVQDLLEESDRDSASLFIDSGKISANVGGADGKRVGFKVRSPIATASVRGTEFSFAAGGMLSVAAGVVTFSQASSNGDKGVPVAAGQESRASSASVVCSSPAEEKALAAAGGLNSTVSLTAEEAISTAAGATSATAAASLQNTMSSAAESYGTVNIVLTF